jgi:hypothetical protein
VLSSEAAAFEKCHFRVAVSFDFSLFNASAESQEDLSL